MAKDKIETIRQLATTVRQEMEKENGSADLSHECLEASNKLKARLIKAGFKAIVVQGTYETDEPCDNCDFETWQDLTEHQKTHPLHYWVAIGDLIADITSDQFNKYLVYDDGNEKVVVEKRRGLSRYRAKHRDWQD